jgi:hypothetical protein
MDIPPPVEATILLIETVPGHAATALPTLIAVRKKMYAIAPRGELKTDAGLDLIDAQKTLAATLITNGNFSEAMDQYKSAATVARLIKSPQFPALSAAKSLMSDRKRQRDEQDRFAARLKANPKDAATAARLVTLLITQADSPQRASGYAYLLADATLKRRVTLAASNSATMTPDEALDLGQWYLDLAKTPGVDRGALYRRSQGYLEQYRSLSTATAIGKTKAKFLLMQTEQRMRTVKQRPTLPPPPASLESAERPDTFKRYVNFGHKQEIRQSRMIWEVAKPFTPGGYGYVAKPTTKLELPVPDRSAIEERTGGWIAPTAIEDPAAIRFTVPPGNEYRITLTLQDSWSTAPGQRAFSVIIEGKAIIKNIDLFKHNQNRTIIFPIKVVVKDAVLDIEFKASKGKPIVSAISVYSTGKLRY